MPCPLLVPERTTSFPLRKELLIKFADGEYLCSLCKPNVSAAPDTKFQFVPVLSRVPVSCARTAIFLGSTLVPAISATTIDIAAGPQPLSPRVPPSPL